MKGKIILEEHVSMPDESLIPLLSFVSRNGRDLYDALIDLHGQRLADMNANGVEFAIMSDNPGGAQSLRDPTAAAAYAVKSNNYIAQLVDRAPERFGAFAALSMHDAETAVKELRRCVQDLGMLGVMLHDGQEYLNDQGEISTRYYDDPNFDVFWAAVQELQTPVYIHPKPPVPSELRHLYGSRPWLIGPTFSFARDATFHVLALCTGGVFDRFPDVKVIVGHLGENVLGQLGRIDHWLEKRDRGRILPAKRTVREYMETNVFITTAGYFSTAPLTYAITEIGADRILFSVDTPYENIAEGATWLDTLPISHSDVAKIGRLNTLKLFPRLQNRLRSSETESLQEDRQRVLYTPNAGF
ncbi:hypothetical protein B0A52_10327 [Exophiala mesophila]|uniref:Amidohydrolase-related domain-containing protein n=1 Tax=Exophiala mesophila TaxID=212818 RepID=A0A438MQ97_EXOME|nr:hypothetical protein B0A52_10327 [Exophiala mesophila]